MRFSFSRLLQGTVVLCFGLLIHSASAQDSKPTATPSTCQIDLDSAIANLAEAQINVSKGDQAAAMDAIRGVRQQLEEIETACTGTSLPTALTQVFTAPSNLFTFRYPGNWAATPFQAGQDWTNTLAPLSPTLPIPEGGSVILSDASLKSGTTSSVLGSTPQQGAFIFVSVGNPLHILESTGLYHQDLAQMFVDGGFTLDTLGEQFLAPLSDLNTATPPALTKVKGKRPMLALDLRTSSAPFYLLFVTLNAEENRYAVLIGAADEVEREGLATLMTSIAETIQ